MIRSLLGACSVAALMASAPALADMNFNRIASFATPTNMAKGEDNQRPTSPEIIAATADGMTLVYTDSPLNSLGLIDLSQPESPKPLGNIALDGEPTAVALIGQNAFVGVNTSASYVEPSGLMKVIDIKTKAVVASCDLGGQPDSVAVAKDGSFVVIAIENERDEDLNDGAIPQLPAGNVVMFSVKDSQIDCESKRVVNLTGLAEVAPTDPEPEFVDVNGLGETVVTLQENNHLVVIDKSGKVVSHFSAGSVDLVDVDLKRDGALTFDKTQAGRLREPDAVKWMDDEHFITANEGDYKGGSRGWTIFNKDGSVVYESNSSFEHALIQIGHYPEKRSGKKGGEPESAETAVFGNTAMAFIGSERGSAVAVYDLTNPSKPVLKQMLPSGIAPEGIVAIPSRNLLVTANEADLVEDGRVRAHVMVYQYQKALADYPTITSEGADTLIGWGALSGMVADAEAAGKIYAVNDSFYSDQPTIFEIDATQKPARIVKATPVTRKGEAAKKLDLEGITLDGQGGFWLASEGRTDKDVPHAIYQVNAQGEIITEIGLPEALVKSEMRFGFEGITKVGDTLWIAVQREWKDDPKHHVKLLSYNTQSKEWGAVHYPIAKADKGWVGLSEITAHGDFVYIVERDNQIGQAAVTKKIYRVALSEMTPATLGSKLPVVDKTLVRDLIPDLKSYKGYVVDKVEGLAIDSRGEMFVSTDNDGVDDSSGETFFWLVGQVK
ncbi:alkaline phosphatase [Leucothrix sargassi]|nr:alkaline phosphatase [Leucothrix sargassi]